MKFEAYLELPFTAILKKTTKKGELYYNWSTAQLCMVANQLPDNFYAELHQILHALVLVNPTLSIVTKMEAFFFFFGPVGP